jgi:peptidoglycan hydrolase CwlO-like protein
MNDFEKSKYTLIKDLDNKKEDIKYLEFEIDNKNNKIEAMKRMIEEYERKLEEGEN